jgi:hypothetical protein
MNPTYVVQNSTKEYVAYAGDNNSDSNCSSPICVVVSKSTRLIVLQCALTATEREFIIEGDKNTLV